MHGASRAPGLRRRRRGRGERRAHRATLRRREARLGASPSKGKAAPGAGPRRAGASRRLPASGGRSESPACVRGGPRAGAGPAIAWPRDQTLAVAPASWPHARLHFLIDPCRFFLYSGSAFLVRPMALCWRSICGFALYWKDCKYFVPLCGLPLLVMSRNYSQ